MTDEKEIRQVMAAGLVEAAKKDDRIVVLDADLMSCHATKCFLEAFPERFINVGIAEANMIGVAAGMAAFGKSRSRSVSPPLRREDATTRFSSPSRTANSTSR